jgi:hypothetical protein
MYNDESSITNTSVHNVSSQDCIPSQRLGLALWMLSEKFLNLIIHRLSSGKFPLKIASFLLSHRLQHPEMIMSITNCNDYLALASVIISWMFISTFHSNPIAHQKLWLKQHSKNKCMIDSCGYSSHNMQSLNSTKKFCTYKNMEVSTIFILKINANEQKHKL